MCFSWLRRSFVVRRLLVQTELWVDGQHSAEVYVESAEIFHFGPRDLLPSHIQTIVDMFGNVDCEASVLRGNIL